MSAFKYVGEHIPGELNYLAEMLSRWSNRKYDKLDATKVVVQSIILAPISPALSDDLNWSTRSELEAIHPKQRPVIVWSKKEHLWTNGNGAVFTPHTNMKMKQRLMVGSHAGAEGHKSAATTKANPATRFRWRSIANDVKSFVDSCLHCISAESGQLVSRPLGHVLQGSNPNELIHFDYSHMGKVTGAE